MRFKDEFYDVNLQYVVGKCMQDNIKSAVLVSFSTDVADTSLYMYPFIRYLFATLFKQFK